MPGVIVKGLWCARQYYGVGLPVARGEGGDVIRSGPSRASGRTGGGPSISLRTNGWWALRFPSGRTDGGPFNFPQGERVGPFNFPQDERMEGPSTSIRTNGWGPSISLRTNGWGPSISLRTNGWGPSISLRTNGWGPFDFPQGERWGALRFPSGRTDGGGGQTMKGRWAGLLISETF